MCELFNILIGMRNTQYCYENVLIHDIVNRLIVSLIIRFDI